MGRPTPWALAGVPPQAAKQTSGWAAEASAHGSGRRSAPGQRADQCGQVLAVGQGWKAAKNGSCRPTSGPPCRRRWTNCCAARYQAKAAWRWILRSGRCGCSRAWTTAAATISRPVTGVEIWRYRWPSNVDWRQRLPPDQHQLTAPLTATADQDRRANGRFSSRFCGLSRKPPSAAIASPR